MKLILNRLYQLFPVFLQNLSITVFGIYWYNRRFGKIFEREYLDCQSREFNTSEQWQNYQTAELRKLLIHCYQTVPYYKNIFREHNIDEAQLKGFQISDLKKIPFLEKETFRLLGTNELISERLEKSYTYFDSSGSTGKPTRTMYSKKMHQRYFGLFERYINNWAGLNYKVPRGVIGGRRIIQDGDSSGPYYRYNYIEKQTYFSAYHISESTAKNYLEGMVKNKVEYMTGYASANYFLAKFIESSGLKAPKLRAVLTSSEKLTDEMRNTFRRVYGCEAFDSYNGVECCNLISECEHKKLHVIPDVGIVEIINADGSPTMPGEVGEIISTGLLNLNQPLVRYRMGDLVRISKNQNCNCGRKMVIVDEIFGRIEDTIIGIDGREMVRFHGVFIGIPQIIESQVVQHSFVDYEIKLVISEALNEEQLNSIRKKMKSQLGEINLEINTVKEIPKSENGKFKSVISYVNREVMT